MLLYLSAQIAKVPSKETEWVTWFVSLFQVTLCVQDSTASFFYTNTSSACSMHLVFNPFGVEWDSVSQLIAPVGGTRVILITGWWFGTWIVFIHILGMSSSQLTNSIMFQRGRLKPPTRYKWVIIPWKQFDIIPPTETIVFLMKLDCPVHQRSQSDVSSSPTNKYVFRRIRFMMFHGLSRASNPFWPQNCNCFTMICGNETRFLTKWSHEITICS